GSQVAAVVAQPPQPHRAVAGDAFLDLRRVHAPAVQTPQAGAEVAAPRDGGQVVEVLEQASAREAADQAQAEGGTADAAARQRQAPGPRRIVADAGLLPAGAHVLVEFAARFPACFGTEDAGILSWLHDPALSRSRHGACAPAGRPARRR